MTDLVQKIYAEYMARAVFGEPLDANTLREAIRQSLADAGGAVAWQYRAGPGDDGWSIAFRNEVLAEMAAKNGQEVRALYAHPDSGRVAELESQLAHVTALHRNAAQTLDGVLETRRSVERELTESRGQVWEFAERLTATRRALCDVRLKTREGSIVWKIADAALAADKEKNDE